MKINSIVLLSGGLDSTVSLAQALREGEVRLCLTFDYGQRAASKEIQAAAGLCKYYGLRHKVIILDFFREITSTALVNPDIDVPSLQTVDLDNPEITACGAAAVWVPNRNGVFINIAAAFAESMGCGQVVTGFNREEAATFPDNSREYVHSASLALSYSTANKVRVVSYTQMLDKIEIVALGRRLRVPWNYIWSCYHGGDRMCGECESCRRYYRAVEKADSRNKG